MAAYILTNVLDQIILGNKW